MKARAVCPACKKEVIESCQSCIRAKILIHCKFSRKGSPVIFENIEWESLKDEV